MALSMASRKALSLAQVHDQLSGCSSPGLLRSFQDFHTGIFVSMGLLRIMVERLLEALVNQSVSSMAIGSFVIKLTFMKAMVSAQIDPHFWQTATISGYSASR